MTEERKKVSSDKSILGLILLTLGTFNFLALLNIWSGGVILLYANILFGLFGQSAYALNVVMIALGVVVITEKKPLISSSRIVKYSLLLVFGIVLVNVILTKQYIGDGIGGYLAAVYNNGKDTIGGVVFALLSSVLMTYLGYAVSVVVFAAVFALFALWSFYPLVASAKTEGESQEKQVKVKTSSQGAAPILPVAPQSVSQPHSAVGENTLYVATEAEIQPESLRQSGPLNSINGLNKPVTQAEEEEFGADVKREILQSVTEGQPKQENEVLKIGVLDGFDEEMEAINKRAIARKIPPTSFPSFDPYEFAAETTNIPFAKDTAGDSYVPMSKQVGSTDGIVIGAPAEKKPVPKTTTTVYTRDDIISAGIVDAVEKISDSGTKYKPMGTLDGIVDASSAKGVSISGRTVVGSLDGIVDATSDGISASRRKENTNYSTDGIVDASTSARSSARAKESRFSTDGIIDASVGRMVSAPVTGSLSGIVDAAPREKQAKPLVPGLNGIIGAEPVVGTTYSSIASSYTDKATDMQPQASEDYSAPVEAAPSYSYRTSKADLIPEDNTVNVESSGRYEDYQGVTSQLSRTHSVTPSVADVVSSTHVSTEAAPESRSNRPVAPQRVVPAPPPIKKEFRRPATSLFTKFEQKAETLESTEQLAADARAIETVLAANKIQAQVVNQVKGPSVTRFELRLDTKTVNYTQIEKYSKNISAALLAPTLVKMDQIWGTDLYGIEVANKKVEIVGFREIIESKEFASTSGIAIAYGKKVGGEIVCLDLQKLPHLLVAGATGYGKSVFLNVLICSIIYRYSPEEVKLILVDPKRIEMGIYNGLPHMLIKERVCETPAIIKAFQYCTKLMGERFKKFETVGDTALIKNIDEYNERFPEDKMPKIVVVVDEMAEIMTSSPANREQIENCIKSLTQLSRAAGIHIVLATQRPSIDVITGVIKNNLPARISFKVTAPQDSKTILERGGADKLVAKGDSLFLFNSDLVRIQSAYIPNDDIINLVNYVKRNCECSYSEEAEKAIYSSDSSAELSDSVDLIMQKQIAELQKDPLYYTVLSDIVTSCKVSTNRIQSRFGFGFPKAAKFINVFETLQYISPPDAQTKAREVWLTEDKLKEIMNGKA